MKRYAKVSLLALVVFALMAATAYAAAVSVSVSSSGRLVVKGNSSSSRIVVSKQGGDYSWLVADSLDMTAGTNCRKAGSDVECKSVKKSPSFLLYGGNDRFENSSGSTVFASGGAGEDYLKGAASADTLEGNDGSDLLFAGAGRNTILGGNGADIMISAGGGKQTVRCADNDQIIVDRQDLVIGCRPVFETSLRRCDGIDYVWRAGNHTAKLSSGPDLAWSGPGRDVLRGMRGADCIFGGGGTDELYGEEDSDILFAGTGSRDLLVAGPGRDYLYARTGSASVLSQSAEADTVRCAGSDVVVADSRDSVRGCQPFRVSASACTKFVSSTTANNTVNASSATFTRLDSGDDTFVGSDKEDCAFGEKGADTLLGGSSKDLLYGGSDADSVYGGDGADTLGGGAGLDKIFGGGGSDKILAVDKAKDNISCGAGADTVSADRADVVAGDCENVRRY